MTDKNNEKPIIKDDIYICPICGSKKLIRIDQCVIYKKYDVKSNKLLNPITLQAYMSNRQKAFEYNAATDEGVGCWMYECRKCGWSSRLFTE